MLKNYFKIGFRNLFRQKSVSFINIAGLSIGIAVCLMLFIIIKFESSFDEYHSKKDRIYRVLTEFHHAQATEVFYGSGVPYALPEELKASFPEIEKVSVVYTDGNDQILVLNKDGFPTKKFKEEHGVFYAEPTLFDIFDYEWLSGNASTLNDPNNVVLTQIIAEKYFDDWESSLGQSIKLNDTEILTVTGVIANIPKNTDLQFKAIISYGTGFTDNYKKSDEWNGTNGAFGCYALLSPNVTEDAVNARLAILSKDKKTGDNKDSQKLQSMSEVHFATEIGNYGGKTISTNLINVLWLIGLFILLIACVNFVNLSTAQAVNRSKEIGVRKVLGSNKSLLKKQFFIETFLIVFISMMLAVGLVVASISSVASMLNIPISLAAVLNLEMILTLVIGTIAITFVAGFYPSIILANFSPIAALKNQLNPSGNKGFTLRRSLVVFQFVIAQVLIIGTVVIVKQMDYFSNQSLGYNKEALVNVSIPTDSIGLSKIDVLRNSLSAQTGIKSVSFNSNTPTENFGVNNWTKLKFNHDTEYNEFYSIIKWVDYNYSNMYELELVAGRSIKKTESITEFLINETLMNSLGVTDPQEMLNKEISMYGGFLEGEIVGVLKDFHDRSFREEISPVFMTNYKDGFTQAGIKLATNDISGSLSSIENLWNEVFPNYVFEYQFLDDKIAQYYEQEQRLSYMYKLFAGIAIFLSCLGLYGLVSFLVVQKIKEVGIRKVLGATSANIVYLFSKEFMILIGIGFFIAAPIAWYFMNEWLQEYAYRIEINWSIFVISGLAAMAIAILTVSFQAIKAALANPVESLKSE